MLDKLVVFGDSFPAGTYYTNGKLNSEQDRIETSFVTQVGNNLGAKVENRSRHANTNLGIYWDVKQYLEENIGNKESQLLLVFWTGLLRESKWDVTTNRFENDKYYYDNYGSDYGKIVWETFNYITACYELIKYYQKKVIMGSSFLDYNTTDVGQMLSPVVKNNWNLFDNPNNTLFDIASDQFSKNGLKNGNWSTNHRDFEIDAPGINKECKHPNKLGHKMIADFYTKLIKDDLLTPKKYTLASAPNYESMEKTLHKSNETAAKFVDHNYELEVSIAKQHYNPKFKALEKKLNLDRDIKYSYNQAGLRGPNFDKDKPLDLFLGCSFTSGVGMEEDKIWPTLVAKELNITNYINAGWGGAGPEGIYERYIYFNFNYKLRNIFILSVSHARILHLDYDNRVYHPVTSANLRDPENSSYKAIPEDIRNMYADKMIDWFYMSSVNLKNLSAIKYLAEQNGQNFYCSTKYLPRTTPLHYEGIIARDILHPGEHAHEFFASELLKKYKDNDQSIDLKAIGES